MGKVMQLKDIQAGFAAQAVPVIGAAPDALKDCVVGNGLAPAARLRVHANNTRLTLTDALSKTFSVVAALTGPDFFGGLAAHYIEFDPPKSAALIDWGASFADFLEGFEPAQQLPYLPDMARLEWAVNESFHAADDAPLNAAALAELDAVRLVESRTPLHGAAQLLRVNWPVDDIWAAHQPGGSLDGVEVQEGDYRLLVTRPQLGVFVHRLEGAAAELAHLLNEGSPFGPALEVLGEEGGPALAHLLSLGALGAPAFQEG